MSQSNTTLSPDDQELLAKMETDIQRVINSLGPDHTDRIGWEGVLSSIREDFARRKIGRSSTTELHGSSMGKFRKWWEGWVAGRIAYLGKRVGLSSFSPRQRMRWFCAARGLPYPENLTGTDDNKEVER